MPSQVSTSELTQMGVQTHGEQKQIMSAIRSLTHAYERRARVARANALWASMLGGGAGGMVAQVRRRNSSPRRPGHVHADGHRSCARISACAVFSCARASALRRVAWSQVQAQLAKEEEEEREREYAEAAALAALSPPKPPNSKRPTLPPMVAPPAVSVPGDSLGGGVHTAARSLSPGRKALSPGRAPRPASLSPTFGAPTFGAAAAAAAAAQPRPLPPMIDPATGRPLPLPMIEQPVGIEHKVRRRRHHSMNVMRMKDEHAHAHGHGH